MTAAEAVLADTRETQEALSFSTPTDTRHDSACKQARKKQLDILESMKVYEEVYAGDAP